MFRSLVGLVVDLRAECVGELLRGAAAFLAQVVTLTEVLAQVLIVAVGRQKSKHKASTQSSVCMSAFFKGEKIKIFPDL